MNDYPIYLYINLVDGESCVLATGTNHDPEGLPHDEATLSVYRICEGGSIVERWNGEEDTWEEVTRHHEVRYLFT